MQPTRTDTVEILVEPVCAWCHIKLSATPTPAVEEQGTMYHEVCHGAMRKLALYTR